MSEQTAPNIVGPKEAEDNVEIIKRYSNFLLPAKEALRVYFFLELAKLFDSSDDSLHISKVVNVASSNLKHLTVEAFAEYEKDQSREFLDQLVAEYKGMSPEDIKEIRESLVLHEGSIKKLKDYRDKWLAHHDLHRTIPPTITGEDLHALFELLDRILNSISSKLTSTRTMWDHARDGARHETKLVLEHLKRFRPYQLKEIEDECTREIEEWKNKSNPDSRS